MDNEGERGEPDPFRNRGRIQEMKSIQPHQNNFPEIIVDFCLPLDGFIERWDAEKNRDEQSPSLNPVLFSQFPEDVSNFNKVTVESV